jgi:hypothetical protein
VLDELIGGWNISGIVRWTSGFPISVDNGFTWATNWNIEGLAMPNGPPPVAPIRNTLSRMGSISARISSPIRQLRKRLSARSARANPECATT